MIEEPDIKFYTLEPSTGAQAGFSFIATAALRFCSICDVQVDSMGGPGAGTICPQCAVLIRRGQIKIDRAKVKAATDG